MVSYDRQGLFALPYKKEEGEQGGNALRSNDASLSGRKNDSADKLERAIAEVLAEGKNVAYDLKLGRADSTAVGTRQLMLL